MNCRSLFFSIRTCVPRKKSLNWNLCFSIVNGPLLEHWDCLWKSKGFFLRRLADQLEKVYMCDPLILDQLIENDITFVTKKKPSGGSSKVKCKSSRDFDDLYTKYNSYTTLQPCELYGDRYFLFYLSTLHSIEPHRICAWNPTSVILKRSPIEAMISTS